ncbi:sedoheptulose 7-phosphate cyclase [Streptomyces sp. NBC_01352]|uniref:2-epi-5-epi-valiolone synthase n=1 Tax=Streptomyces plumbiresistens TaxID=511811 RepID=A0ABP7S801_9ACTN|nr:sedoheptulose 7-phosphate cyclase [Streptomyces sp. NBC_01352]
MTRDNAPTGLFTRSAQVDVWQVNAVKPVSYEIRMCEDAFDPADEALLEPASVTGGDRRRFVVIDAHVERLHGERIRAYLDHHRVDYRMHVVEVDETLKELATLEDIVRALDAFSIDRRREPLIAIGGGVLMDIVGLVASLYRRGTPVVRVPTTLIGLVDAGVGVKTGVNFNGHKNRLGTYFPASLTLLDRSFLATVDRRHISNGLAEVLKMALIKDARLFDLLESHGPALIENRLQGSRWGTGRAACEVVQRAIHGMLEELQPNLWETQLERVVDYGHTFSPTIEMHALPALLHGEAVCVDMALTTVMAARRGMVSAADRDRILAVMDALELPTWNDLLEPGLLARALADTVRHRDGRQRLPLPVGIGDAAFVNDVTPAELAAAIDDLRTLGTAGRRGAVLEEAA